MTAPTESHSKAAERLLSGQSWDDFCDTLKVAGKVIDQLGDTCKKVLMYYYFEEMSMQDIADKLGFANTDTAKTKKYKCKKKLDELVKAQYSEQDFLD